MLGESGQVVEEGSVTNNRVALSELSSRYPGALIVMEAGCHSPWVSRHLEQAGGEVIVSNPRKTRAIYQHERKSDRRDALMLAALPGWSRRWCIRCGTEAKRRSRIFYASSCVTVWCERGWD